MDFSTHNIAVPDRTQPLELALRCLVDNSVEHILCKDNPHWSRRKTKTHPGNHVGGGMHSHPYPEIAMVLEGQCVMDYQDSAFPVGCGDIVICPPQVEHCEGIIKTSMGYSILWIVISQQSMLALVSRFVPSAGWDTPYRWTFRNESVQRLFGWFKDHQMPLITQWYMDVRSELFFVLSNLYQQSLRETDRVIPSSKSPVGKHEPILRRIQDFLKNHYTQSITLKQLAQSAGMSPNYLNNLFSRHMGLPIHSYLIQLRMEHAKRLFMTTDMLVKQVAREVGYDDPLYFSRAFRKYHGQWPSTTQTL